MKVEHILVLKNWKRKYSNINICKVKTIVTVPVERVNETMIKFIVFILEKILDNEMLVI